MSSAHPLRAWRTVAQQQIIHALGSRGIRQYAISASAGPKVNGTRLWQDIHHTCQWGTGHRWGNKPHETGMSRLALTYADKEARDWFVNTSKVLGCEVTVDAMGNTFAVRPGRRKGPPTCAGSHLDTQPTGGRYDGILGVCAGVEMLRVLKENNLETEYPVGVINWTNEEGARFPASMVSSGVWSGNIHLEKAHGLVEVGDGGRTMKDELQAIGYLGKMPASYKAMPIGAHFELHIEQGPRLENQQLKIGIVTGVQAYNWFTCTVMGRDCHTGTTPLDARQDAMLVAAKMIHQSHNIAQQHKALISTGIIKAWPGSVNTVPGKVDFSLDVRAPTDAALKDLIHGLKSSLSAIIGEHKPMRYELTSTFESAAVKFHHDCIKCVEESAAASFGESHLKLVSGAGHDSVFTNKRVPTSMIFVPCKNGVSHHPEEYCSPDDCANGAQILMDSILRYDGLRAEKGV